jgi:uncharacterized protein YndB with AHSA1/START domain
MKPARIALLTLLAVGIFSGVPSSSADVKSAAPGSFTIEQDLLLPAAPDAVYDALTGDMSPWWDHTFSQKPKKLSIEAKPGGGFWEIFNDAGDGVLHATVIYAERGKRLRFSGPLGLSGNAVNMVTTYDLKAEGSGTRFHMTTNASGQVDESTAKIVDQVWHHFLVERFKPYIESGEYKKPHAMAGDSQHPQPVKATVADFAWMAGRWTGTVGTNPIEYDCSQPRLGQMMCMFRVLDDKNVLGLEFVSLEETSEGLKEHVRFYSPSLSADGPDAVTMELESVTPDQIVFVNPNGSRPKRTTTLRNGQNAFTSHIVMIDEQGKPSAMDAHWVRAK